LKIISSSSLSHAKLLNAKAIYKPFDTIEYLIFIVHISINTIVHCLIVVLY
jgi:hypothetical protein